MDVGVGKKVEPVHSTSEEGFELGLPQPMTTRNHGPFNE